MDKRGYAEEVIAEAQRLLSGRTFDTQRGYRRRGWALIGALAHGGRAEPQKLATAGISSHPASATWDAVLAYLAGEALDGAPSGPALVQVQPTGPYTPRAETPRRRLSEAVEPPRFSSPSFWRVSTPIPCALTGDRRRRATQAVLFP